MNIRINPFGKPRVIYFNYSGGQNPATHSPVMVIVRPNETPLSDFFSGKFWENLGVLTLTSYMVEAGIKFGVLEASLFQCTKEETASLALEHGPNFVGISTFSTDMLDECLSICTYIKKISSLTQTILGGHGASFVHQEILDNNPDVDCVIRGEGEYSLLALLQTNNRAEWKNIANLSYRNDNKIHINPIGPVPPDLDQVLLPHTFIRELIAKDKILSKAPLMSVASRGCFDRCAFCSVTEFYAKNWRGRSPKHVVDEVENLVMRFNQKSIHFWDDTFIGPGNKGRARALTFSEELKSRNLNITFHITTRPSDLNKEVIEALADAGLRSIFLGVESSSQSTLDYFDKHADVEHSKNAIQMLWNNGVHRILAGFILFHPRASFESIRQDLNFLDSFPFVELSRLISRLSYYPGARFWTENRSQLEKDAYKKYVTPSLSSAALESLYHVSLRFYANTLRIETVFVCLEEQYLHDSRLIKILAQRRTELFRFISARLCRVANDIEARLENEERIKHYCGEIYQKSLAILESIKINMQDEYFDLLLESYRLEDYNKYMKPNSTELKVDLQELWSSDKRDETTRSLLLVPEKMDLTL